jgi:hypothetical protein
VRAWRYITARVLDEFPETVFLLEGLGGSWEATETLLTEGAMQWAYSELFQNYSGLEIASYLEYALRQSRRVGLYVHYSETHDNNRLAERGRDWSLLRNRLCALTSVSGGFGFTCGVEWLAAEKVNVHSSRGLSWGQEPNMVKELAELNALLRSHPCFFDGANLTRVTEPDSPVYALLRESADSSSRVLVVVNTDAQRAQFVRFDASLFAARDQQPPHFDPAVITDLLAQPLPPMEFTAGKVEMGVPPAAVFCLALTIVGQAPPPAKPASAGACKTETGEGACPTQFGAAQKAIAPFGDDALRFFGSAYRRARAQAAFAVKALSCIVPAEETASKCAAT